MTPSPSAQDRVNAALAEVTTHDAATALALYGRADVLFVDLREPAETERDGAIAGAFSAPRGVLEFWADKDSPWHRPELTRPGVELVLFCAIGWRSALAAQTLQQMGMPRVSHLGGGLVAWKAAGGPVEPVPVPVPMTAPAPAPAPLPTALTLQRIQARANRLANHRLQQAMSELSLAELHAPRTAFFPSLMATLNHILDVDAYYVGVLYGQTDGHEQWASFVPAADLPTLAARQCAVDERLIAWLDGAGEADLAAPVAMPRGQGRIQRDAAAHMVQHLFMHQTHHRGHVHAMLSGTHVPPPQLDEFLMPSEGHLRTDDMAALGWTEADVYGR